MGYRDHELCYLREDETESSLAYLLHFGIRTLLMNLFVLLLGKKYTKTKIRLRLEFNFQKAKINKNMQKISQTDKRHV